MRNRETFFKVKFENSGKTAEVSLRSLVSAAIEFLEHYGTAPLVGKAFTDITGEADGSTKFERLLEASGYRADPDGFFRTVLNTVEKSHGREIAVNNIAIPSLFVVALLEKIIPGSGYVSIKDVDQLEKVTNIKVPEEDRGDMQKVIDMYPVRISRHTARQMMASRDVAYQYLPFTRELDAVGHTNTWIGQFHQGLLEQMYQNRVIFLLNMSCPVYCRFCFRKHKESRSEKNPTAEDVSAAVNHVRNSPSIKEIVITGGDPFMNRENMAAAIDGLMEIDHVQSLRLATRSIAYYPDLFLADDAGYLKYLKQKNLELQQNGKRMEVATHFIHPDEISPESLDIITDLVKNGIPVYVQTPFLNDCNDKGPELVKLFRLLRGAGAELHYIYIPCSPIHGNSIYWSPIASGIDAAHHLRAHLSDRVIPRICTATPIGKMDWHTSGWAVEKVAGNDNFIWIRTPYTPEYFKAFAPLANELSNIRINDEGTIDIQYMADIGNESLLLGPRPVRAEKERIPAEPGQLVKVKESLKDGVSPVHGIVPTQCDRLLRVHETRVEIDPEAREEAMAYIRSDHRITDVVIASGADAIDRLYHIGRIVRSLQDIPHVNAVRLRSMKFNREPETYTTAVINRLGDLNRLAVADPLRLEIETWFLEPREVKPVHAKVVRRLNNKGITVYSNTPLLGGVNDTADIIHELAFLLRQAGIEFHHLYAAGLPVQEKWNREYPVDTFDVIDIATKVRREGSGREIPRYIIQTPLGEVDYGLTSTFLNADGKLSVKLDCYDRHYFEGMERAFTFPDNVRIDKDGRPVVPLTGLVASGNFPI